MSTLRRLLFFPLIPATVILCQSFARAQSQLPDAQSKAAGSISGRLTIGDKPAPGILVTASGVTAQKIAGQATSDNDGNHRIGGLAPGQLNIMPAAPVYVLPALDVRPGQGRRQSFARRIGRRNRLQN